MSLVSYLLLFRRRWLFIVGLPLLIALISFGVGVTQPPQFQASTRVLVARGVTDPNSTAGVTWAREDTVAQDLPTILNSSVFARDVASEAQRQGVDISEANVIGAIQGANEGKIVTITVRAQTPEATTAILEAAVAALQANGLRYWGDPTWTPETPGVNIGPLDQIGVPSRVPTTRDLVGDAAMRAGVGLIVAVALVVGFAQMELRTLTKKSPTTVSYK